MIQQNPPTMFPTYPHMHSRPQLPVRVKQEPSLGTFVSTVDIDTDMILGSPPSSPILPTHSRKSSSEIGRPSHSRSNSSSGIDDNVFADYPVVHSARSTPGHSRNSSASSISTPVSSARSTPCHSRNSSREINTKELTQYTQEELNEILKLIDWHPGEYQEKPQTKPKRENASKESQQEKHKSAERRRRNDMNDMLDKIKTLLPMEQKESKMTKITILHEIAEYVERVQPLCVQLLRENKKLNQDVKNLTDELTILKEHLDPVARAELDSVQKKRRMPVNSSFQSLQLQ